MRRLAVNLRLVSDPEQVALIPIDHFDGLATFEDLPLGDRTLRRQHVVVQETRHLSGTLLTG